MATQTQHYGKFRHVFGKAAKPDKQFLELPSPLTSGEGPYVRASAKYFAFSGSSVRKLYVRSLDCGGRFNSNESFVGPDCLKGKIWDFSFHPNFDNIIALGDDCGKICLVTLPESIETNGKLTENITKATVDLGNVHSKKVVLLSFHPCANNVLASASFDRTVKLFNIENQTEICNINSFGDTIYSIDFNKHGTLIAASSKDKNIRIVDPRNLINNNNNSNGIDITIEKAFDGSKSSKLFWVNNGIGNGFLGCTGFSKLARRELKLWDLRKTDKAIINHTIDQAASVMMPHYDSENNILYLAGKGDGSIQFGEFRNDYSGYHPLSTYRSPEPQRGGGWVPKRGLNVWKCEIERFLKLTRKSIIPVSFIVPRKSGEDIFQSDIYPDAPSGEASMTADEWINGGNKETITMSLDPSQRSNYTMTYRRSTLQQTRNVNNINNASNSSGSLNAVSPKSVMSPANSNQSLGSHTSNSNNNNNNVLIEEKKEETNENDLQNSRIETLEKENNTLKNDNKVLTEKVSELEATIELLKKQLESNGTTETTVDENNANEMEEQTSDPLSDPLTEAQEAQE